MILKKEKVTHWGKEVEISPVLISEIFGDGKLFIYIQPLNTRPDFYFVRVDSGIDLEDIDLVTDYFEDYDGGVLAAIEDEWGDGCGDGEPFPALDLSCGYAFGLISNEAVIGIKKQIGDIN